MEESDSHTESLRVERGERADEGRPAPGATPMSLGSMIQGPIGKEGASDEDGIASEVGAVDRGVIDQQDR